MSDEFLNVLGHIALVSFVGAVVLTCAFFIERLWTGELFVKKKK